MGFYKFIKIKGIDGANTGYFVPRIYKLPFMLIELRIVGLKFVKDRLAGWTIWWVESEEETTGDLYGDNLIGFIKEGCIGVYVTLKRYAETKNSEFNNRIGLEELVDLDGSSYMVKNKEIKIKYCPFCGEKL